MIKMNRIYGLVSRVLFTTYFHEQTQIGYFVNYNIFKICFVVFCGRCYWNPTDLVLSATSELPGAIAYVNGNSNCVTVMCTGSRCTEKHCIVI